MSTQQKEHRPTYEAYNALKTALELRLNELFGNTLSSERRCDLKPTTQGYRLYKPRYTLTWCFYKHTDEPDLDGIRVHEVPIAAIGHLVLLAYYKDILSKDERFKELAPLVEEYEQVYAENHSRLVVYLNEHKPASLMEFSFEYGDGGTWYTRGLNKNRLLSSITPYHLDLVLNSIALIEKKKKWEQDRQDKA